MTDRSLEDVRDGVGLAAYLILLQLLALLEEMGVASQSITAVVSRAREVAQRENEQQASPVLEVAWRLLRGLESGRAEEAAAPPPSRP
jgi:hypothetical protein